MTKNLKRVLKLGAVAVILLSTVACAQPRFIIHMTHRDGDKTMKLVSMQNRTFNYPKYDVVKCNMADDGRLSQCRALNLSWNLD